MLRRMSWLALALVLTAILSGCGSSTPTQKSSGGSNEPGEPSLLINPWQIASKPNQASPLLESAENGTLAQLLTKSREELATLADDCQKSIAKLEKLHREDQLPFRLLPNVRVPRFIPVFRQAKYAKSLGISLPPYVAEGSSDTEVALHLARYGDLEAARKLVDPGDAAALARLEALKLENNYPLEWTRLVGLLLYRGQFLLATDHVEYGKKLMTWHKQLRQVLDARARDSHLGAALLPRGTGVLKETAAYYRANEHAVSADEVESALADWGDFAALTLPIGPGTPRKDVERLIGSAAQGKSVFATPPQRALDLLCLPFPDEGLDTLVASFDANDRLVEVLLSYGARVGDYYGQPAKIAHCLEENKLPQKTVATSAQALPRRAYVLGDQVCEVFIVPQHPVVGVLVRVGRANRSAPPVLSRDFGPVHFDRSFEQIRQRVALDRRANPLTFNDPKDLALLSSPVAALPPLEVVLQRSKSHDVLESLRWKFDCKQIEKRTLAEIVKPLSVLGGAPRIEADRDQRAGHLSLIWEDRQTQYVLKLPNAVDRNPELIVRDFTDPQQRYRVAYDKDQSERKARFTAKSLVTRLPRELADVRLEMSRAEIVKLFAKAETTLVRDSKEEIVVTFAGASPANATMLVRELAARFDQGSRVTELRVRGSDRADQPGSLAQRLEQLKREGGLPEIFLAPWAAVWSEPPVAKPAPLYFRWYDDVTIVTWQQDAHGVEVTLRDRPSDHAGGLPLPPLAYLQRGPEDCLLGTTRQELSRQWKLGKTVKVGTALVLTPRQPHPYDTLLVWLEKEKVVRVVARHKASDRAKATPEELAKAVQGAWSARLQEFGWPRRPDYDANRILRGWANHDDRTRIRIFWQQNADASRELFTEWKEVGQ